MLKSDWVRAHGRKCSLCARTRTPAGFVLSLIVLPICSNSPQFGGQTPLYTWEQDELEVTIKVPVPADVTAKNISWYLMPKRATLAVNGNTVFEGELCANVNSEDSNWELERDPTRAEGKRIVVTLIKVCLVLLSALTDALGACPYIRCDSCMQAHARFA